jgi:ParB family chromosome partitioning protein
MQESYRDLPISEIVIPKSHRPTDPERVASLAKSIEAIGLLCVILTNEDYRLIAGRHRIEACKLLGWKTIPARILDLPDLQAELAEIDENLERNQLTALEYTQALARRKAIYEAMHPDTKAGGDRKSSEKIKAQELRFDPAPSFTEETAKATGKSARSIQVDVAIAEALDPEAAETIADVPEVADNKVELTRLGKLPPKEQRAVAAKIKAGKAASVKAITQPSGGGKSKTNITGFAKLDSKIGEALREADALHKAQPGDKFHRDIIRNLKDAIVTAAEWKKAVR